MGAINCCQNNQSTDKFLQKRQKTIKGKKSSKIVLLGDIGGTNTRLYLKEITNDKQLNEKTDYIKEDEFRTQKIDNLYQAIDLFLDEFEEDQRPQIGVIGVAGAINQNICQEITNAKHWGVVDGNQIKNQFNFEQFYLINDFEAAGYGIINMKEDDIIKLNDSQQQLDGVKAIIGPGTGLGQCFLVKDTSSSIYQVYPSEGGHVEFCPRNQEDLDLLNFAKQFIETSENVENQKGRGKIDRVSVERLVAGPALPLLYEFLSEKNQGLGRKLEKKIGKQFNEIKPEDITQQGLIEKDLLCLKVVNKFIELLAVECGNFALKVLPYGGLYLVGKISSDLQEYIQENNIFLDNFYMKGRLQDKIKNIPIYLVKNDNIGIVGAEEFSFRLINHI